MRREGVEVFGWLQAQGVTVQLNKSHGKSRHLMKQPVPAKAGKRPWSQLRSDAVSTHAGVYIHPLESAQESKQSHAGGDGITLLKY